ncbi:MAG: DUF2330 domain-containing protein [bacterium]|nr:DUF2330 domain-containing protein [bacterium]
MKRLYSKFCFLLIFLTSISLADRGMISITRPDISIYEPGQKAIIGWDGNNEVMILAVDARADTECKVLEILPLPSKPTVDEGNFKSFEEIQRLIRKNAPRIEALYKGRELLAPGVEILFHKKIGPHNITCVKALEYREFVNWILNFVKSQGVDTISMPHELLYIINNYLRNGIQHFVFDIVELSKETNSIVPLIYKFKSPYLFFPLHISTLAKGDTRIQVFLVTKHIPWPTAVEPFRIGKYRAYGPKREGDIIFKVTKDELKSIEPALAKLIRNDAWLTAIEFEGNISELTTDLKLNKFCKIIEE